MTPTEYLQLVGLCEVLKSQRKALEATERALYEHLGIHEDDDRRDHVSDSIFLQEPLAHIVSRLDLEVPDLRSPPSEGTD